MVVVGATVELVVVGAIVELVVVGATLAQLEAIRAQGNAQLDALLAGCPAP